MAARSARHFLTLALCCGIGGAASPATAETCGAGAAPEDDGSGLLQQSARADFGALEAEAPPVARRKAGCKRRGRGRGRGHAGGSSRRPTLNASAIPKFVAPMAIPPVMRRACKAKVQEWCPPVYDIAVRRFDQQILFGAHWNNPAWGVLDSKLPADQELPATTVFGYGPAQDPEPDSSALPGGRRGLAPAGNSQFNYPAYTVENVRDRTTTVNWINNLVKDPWACDWRMPKGKACEFIPHIVPVDQSLHWANPDKWLTCANNSVIDCRPNCTKDSRLSEAYHGPIPMVVHLHGGHTASDSDGYPEAWWLPAASNLDGYVKTGSVVNKLGRTTNYIPGVATYKYANDQPSAALWYHDHSLGMTRANVYAGPVGFWLVRDECKGTGNCKGEGKGKGKGKGTRDEPCSGGESGLVEGTLPGPAPGPNDSLEDVNLPPGRYAYREMVVAVQDKSFNLDGSLFYPKDRAFFEELEPEQLRIPFVGNKWVESDIPPIWNPEAFFDVMVVNGVAWPVLEVEPDLYRLRLLNGCQSRFLNLLVCRPNADGKCPVTPEGKPEGELEIMYQIGAEQSLLPKVVQVSAGFKTELPGNGGLPAQKRPAASTREGLLMGPSERADTLFDFRGLNPGDVLLLINTGPDAPFAGFDDPEFEMASEDTTRLVMQFRVRENTPRGDSATSPEELVLSLPDKHDPANIVSKSPDCSLPPPAAGSCAAESRPLALLEEDSALICKRDVGGAVVWDPLSVPDPENPGTCKPKSWWAAPQPGGPSTPFGPKAVLLGIRGNRVDFEPKLWVEPITELPAKGTTEIWEFWNWSGDAHPMHVHLVKFRVLQRVRFDAGDASPGAPLVDVPTENGWKDTVIAYPGTVTRVAATFDLCGLYVWHCHILEHEDQEMMRPFRVTGSGSQCSHGAES